MIQTDEGYIDMSTGSPEYCYYIKDHQGNNRVVENQAGVVLQSNHYYPFGMTFGEGIASSNQRYKYNGKELDRMHGLDLYDYGARMYDSAIGRWGTMDPLAEKFYSVSPYAYCFNNPIKFVDIRGEEPNYYGIKNDQKYGVMVVLPNSWHNDKSLTDVFNSTKENGIPVMFVDNMKDLKDGMNHLKDIGVSVNAYSITQHGKPGKTEIGDQKINSETNFTSLKEGFSGKNILINACNVVKDKNDEGVTIIKNISKETGARSVVASGHPLKTNTDYKKGHTLNNNGKNSYMIKIQEQKAKEIIDFSVGRNGTFYWGK